MYFHSFYFEIFPRDIFLWEDQVENGNSPTFFKFVDYKQRMLHHQIMPRHLVKRADIMQI